MVYLITGKQGAGKTHYATALAEELRQEGAQVRILDGDEWRALHNNQDFTDEGRLKNLCSAAEYAARLEAAGNIVLMAFIAPRKEWRNHMRTYWKESKVVYIPGGSLWTGTIYEKPDREELK